MDLARLKGDLANLQAQKRQALSAAEQVEGAIRYVRANIERIEQEQAEGAKQDEQAPAN